MYRIYISPGQPKNQPTITTQQFTKTENPKHRMKYHFVPSTATVINR